MRDDDDPLDPDRAAILARRRQFIALALSGLATTACTDGGGQGKPKADGADAADTRDQGPPPQPCLSPVVDDPPPEPTTGEAPEPGDHHPPPHACLKVARPKPEGETDGALADPPEPKPEPKPDPRPRVCLRKAAPSKPGDDGPA